ncbi:hypothetical protein BDW22DRAFT_1432610 [Trametopsis cervina]|nr:hypothetical protein BDW22DRAFT_1432610 [Trametopsis cervina]
MDCYETRLESFKKGKRVKVKNSTVLLKWPHPKTYAATPEQLAEAGFYYNPSPEARDSVKCFMCRKELDQWDEDDDPISVHFARCRDICAWAIARCGNVEDLDPSGGFTFKDPTRAPNSKTMEKARYDTFTSGWPHDDIRGHGASSKKMSKAGFLYAPHTPGDDTAICVYCTTTLSGWDQDDDPLEEHRKRVGRSGRRCAFFEMLDGSSKPAQTSRATKPPSRSLSQSTSRKKVAEIEEEIPEELSSDEHSMQAATATSKSRRTTRSSSVPSKTPASRKSTRTAGTSGRTKGTGASETDDDAEASGSDAGKRVSKSKKKGTKKAKEKIEVIEEVEEEAVDENMFTEEEPVAPKPKRGRPPKAKAASGVSKIKKTPDNALEGTEMELAIQKSTHTRTRSNINAESEFEPVPAKPLAQPKSKTSAKSRKVDQAPSETEGSRRKGATQDFELDSLLMPPPKLKGRATAPPSSAIEIESDDEEPKGQTYQEPAVKSSKKTPSTRPAEGQPSRATPTEGPPSQAKGRKSSSTSDDTGYATAEQPMDVDDQPVAPKRPIPRIPRQKDIQEKLVLTANVVPTKHVAHHDKSETSGRTVDQSTDPAAHFPQPKRPSKTYVNLPQRVGSLGRPPSRIGTEVVDISSDDDDELDMLQTIGSNKPSSENYNNSNAVLVPPHLPVNKERPHSPHVLIESQLHIIPQTESTEHPNGVAEVLASTVTPTASPVIPPDVQMDEVRDFTVYDSQAGDLESKTVEGEPTPIVPNLIPPTLSQPSEVPVPPPPALLSFDEELAADKPDVSATTVEAFIPFLSMVPMQKLGSLSDEESDMTLEQYIRRQLEVQYQQFRADGEKQIAQFKQRAAEARSRIEAL